MNSLRHAGLGNISMHITGQPHVGDLTQLGYTLPGFRFDHAICIPFVGQQLSQASIFSTTALILNTAVAHRYLMKPV